jgi:hypothetical protein
MRDVYRHLRNIYLITRTCEQRMALVPEPKKLSALSFRSFLGNGRKQANEPVDGFKFVEGEICAVSNRIFRDHPRRCDAGIPLRAATRLAFASRSWRN